MELGDLTISVGDMTTMLTGLLLDDFDFLEILVPPWFVFCYSFLTGLFEL